MLEYKKKKLDKAQIVIGIVMGIWALLILFPFYNAILASISTQREFSRNPLMLFPQEVTFSAYSYLMKATSLMTGYRNTLFFLALGVPFSMLITVSTAYVLSRPSFPGKKIYVFLVLFTMYFSGGMVPIYLLMKEMKLTNSLVGIVLLYGGNTFYAILIRNFFQSIPHEIEESAKIDGASEMLTFFRIILPLSVPILMTVILFLAVDRWNEWFNVMLMVRDSNKWTLQVILRNIVYTTLDDMASRVVSVQKTYYSLSLKMAAIVLTMAPVMIFYPFTQRFFIKGIMIGSVKG
ncbi:MAG TPA: carbohydrate ABC transporter permease [Candidatus Limiplasma sp.]|jgi:putative aldouronate transport system permease protein|nr:carbohydrate ABC transporter permease [Candidatus Limiplasma sp.]HPR77083.1 carbohydrate ABC transporter permease [Candidatus Limiplasma sp.]